MTEKKSKAKKGYGTGWEKKYGEYVANMAIVVLAGHQWAKHRNFDKFFDQEKYDEDRAEAEKILRGLYNENKPLKDILELMTKMQADVIYWRRVLNGGNLLSTPEQQNRDTWEAKRYIAYLFFDDVLHNCINIIKCPDFSKVFNNPDIFNLMKSLTIEEYCRIKSYLLYLGDQNKMGVKEECRDDKYFLGAMGYLDQAFYNCDGNCNKKINSKYRRRFSSKKEDIIKAKYNPHDRLGDMNIEDIKKFVDAYYSFIEKYEIPNDQKDPGDSTKNQATTLLEFMYDKKNSKFVNMMEFSSKCMIASYVDRNKHETIRSDAKKTYKLVQRTIAPAKEPFFVSPQISLSSEKYIGD